MPEHDRVGRGRPRDGRGAPASSTRSSPRSAPTRSGSRPRRSPRPSRPRSPRRCRRTSGSRRATSASRSSGPAGAARSPKRAVQGLVVFLVLVVVFLSAYFEWRLAVAALVALVHDLVITIGIYALTGFEVTPATVIGVLTILGFSLYDTVVVFDKVRENTRGITSSNRVTYSEAANLALNQTLVRSINTSIVALLPGGRDPRRRRRSARRRHAQGPRARAVHRHRGRHLLVDLHRDAGRLPAAGAPPGDEGPRGPRRGAPRRWRRRRRPRRAKKAPAGAGTATAVLDEAEAEAPRVGGRARAKAPSRRWLRPASASSRRTNSHAQPAQEEVTSELDALLDERVRAVADWPVPGVTFRDITPLLADPRGLPGDRGRHRRGASPRPGSGRSTSSPGIEARGFVLGAPLAVELGVGFVPVRKQGKLPGDVHAETYDLEYGTATLEMQVDAVASRPPGADRRRRARDRRHGGRDRRAAARRGGQRRGVSPCCIELPALGGRAALGDLPVVALRAPTDAPAGAACADVRRLSRHSTREESSVAEDVVAGLGRRRARVAVADDLAGLRGDQPALARCRASAPGRRRSPAPHPELEPLLRTVKQFHPKADVKILEQAYERAAYLHRDQRRRSRRPVHHAPAGGRRRSSPSSA